MTRIPSVINIQKLLIGNRIRNVDINTLRLRQNSCQFANDIDWFSGAMKLLFFYSILSQMCPQVPNWQ